MQHATQFTFKPDILPQVPRRRLRIFASYGFCRIFAGLKSAASPYWEVWCDFRGTKAFSSGSGRKRCNIAQGKWHDVSKCR